MLYINDLPITNFKDVEIIEEVSGSLTLSFTSFNFDNKAHHLLKEEEIVNIDGYDFVIKQISESTYTKQVAAVSTFFKLGGNYRHVLHGGTRRITEFIEFALNGTGWTYSFDGGSDSYIFIPNFGNDNSLKLIQGLCEVAKMEYKIMPNNHVSFTRNVRFSRGAQYRYGHNIKAINKQVDTTNLVTKLKGIGYQGLSLVYHSPNISKFGTIEGEPIINEDINDEELLLELVKQEITDVPEITIELDAIELKDRELGEYVWLIYEPLDIELESRILQITKTIRNGQLTTKSVVLGNHKPKTQTDLLAKQQVEIDANRKLTMSYIEQTNDRIRLAVEEINGELEEQKAELEITADKIRTEVSHLDKTLSDQITEANSSITQTAYEIYTQISKDTRYLENRIESTRSEIRQTAENLTGQFSKEISIVKNDNKEMIESAQAEFNLGLDGLKNNITATKKELDGKITKAESKIEQTKKDINLQLSSEIDGVNKSIDDLGTTFSRKESQLKLDINSISSRVTSESKRLDGRINNANSSITQTASSIRSEVRREVSGVNNNIANINKDVTGIKNAVSRIEQEADRIWAEVEAIDDHYGEEMTQHSARLDIMHNQISTKVSAGDIASEINQTAQSVKIRASKIQMDGIVRVSDSIDLGTTTHSNTKAVRFNKTDAWIYSTGNNLYLSAEYLFLDGWTEALSPISHRQGGLVLAPDKGLWIGLLEDGRLRVSNGDQARYFRPS